MTIIAMGLASSPVFAKKAQAWPVIHGVYGGSGAAPGLCYGDTFASTDGCSGAHSSAWIQHSTFFGTNSGGVSSGGYAQQDGQTYVTSSLPTYFPAGIKYPVGPYTALGSLTDGWLTPPTGCTAGGTSAAPTVTCSGVSFVGWAHVIFAPINGHDCPVVTINSGPTATDTYYDDYALISGPYCNTTGYQLRFQGGSFNKHHTNFIWDGCAQIDAYCTAALTGSAHVTDENSAGDDSMSYFAALGSMGRFVNISSVAHGNYSRQYFYVEDITAGTVQTSFHGEFDQFNGNAGETYNVNYSYGNCLQKTDAYPNNTTSCFYFGGTSVNVAAEGDHNVVVANNYGSLSSCSANISISGTTLTLNSGGACLVAKAAILGGVTASTSVTGGSGTTWTVNNSQTVSNINITFSYQTTSAGFELPGSTITSAAFNNNFIDLHAMYYAFSAAGAHCNQAATFSGNVNIVTGASITTFGSNTGTGC